MTDPARTPTSPARFGLTEARSGELLRAAGWWDDRRPTAGSEPVLWALSRSPDPDLALLGVDRLREALGDGWAELDGVLRSSAVLRGRLLAVLGSSTALSDFLVANPDRWAALAEAEPVSAEVFAPVLVEAVRELTGSAAVRALRSEYRALLCRIAAEDLARVVEPDLAHVPYDEVAGLLSDLAVAALRAALDVASRQVARAGDCTLAVIAMGKCGARELNYVSDVDVVFVGEGDTAVATRLAGAMMQVAGQACFEVDAALRPEGKAGALVRTLEGHAAYYRRWARTWEFQALLKARPVAGDAELGRRYLEVVGPLVWTAAEREDFVPDVQAMRRRVEDHVPVGLADRELKLGPGGLRDVEFAVQLLQLVHGRGDEELRIAATTAALAALGRGGYVGRTDAADFGRAYRFLRTLEHRLQLQRLLRTHLFPAEDDFPALRRLARAAGLSARGGLSEAQVLLAEFRKRANQVRRLHEKLFYRPLLQAVANVPTEALRLTTAEAAARLAALGYAAPDGALRHIEALTRGVSRRARIQTALLPVLLDLLAATPDPDGGLLAYRRVSEALAETPWYLRLLRDEGTVVDRLAALLGTSKLVPDLLVRAPEVLRLLADTSALVGLDPMTIGNPLRSTVSRYNDLERAVTAARSLRRHELLRVASADLLGLASLRTVCVSLSEVWVAVLQAALDAVVRTAGERLASIAVIGMGRLGGRELGYGSDADVLFVCEAAPGVADADAVRYAAAVVEKVRRLLSAPSQDPALQVDADLRPEGRQGPLVRTLESYRTYYAQWSELWEAQALLRARVVAGDADLGARFIELVEPVRYPADGLDAASVREVRRIKARVEAERLPRGADPSTHTKLGRGGLADVEWTVQLLQLQHAHEVPSLRTPSTVRGMRAACEAGLVAEEDASALMESWVMATRARNAVVLVRGKPGDQLPTAGRDLAAVAGVMGHPGDPGEFLDSYRRTTRRARAVVERVFYGS
ncbi:bifunctional [glutamine synthetase] adenylyltransferase/[glutamine synthetase]-adenylyl-L-tyrosine phosphorylase [Saccharothrix algeriensis]|uniref:Bifunctional glutamine synthetase adenylyltransferase/adenylyl-removing enzyme n=1 Tax=Saccharothrix algeriensis TaxID=173560 RepID=A0A8T8I387_9PSEU|nr:bifunctional [glutamine synthetase] adenylyltransferase/[glutamine synthetase]-adenylyl-L-tyrosine phosphorylase [Saccharothrix algeriensis]MBM7811291.1 glutamate-ammonia-ligase adenylyltransferase [Saccharothrix algeriensis]QTR05187.1 bifunctional [glutamine synthetase] adenylyltransferase/[glutamine synthetase]-adenylyl-L-tyrosine phosphorylase [Saccharothrix algeriensis]